MNKFVQPKFLASVLTFLILTFVLLVMSVNTTDNRKYDDILSQNNLYFSEGNYSLMQYYNEAKENSLNINSQNLIIRIAIAIDKLCTRDNIFDVRFLALIQILSCSLAVYLISDYLTYKKNKFASYIISVLSVFIFADTSYSAYFNSLFAENIRYTSFLISVASILLLSQKRYNKYFLISLIAVNTLFFVFAQFPRKYTNIDKYSSMTRGILMTSNDLESSLNEFGIDQQFTLLAYSDYSDRYTIIEIENNILQNNFYSHYNFVSVSLYYLKHFRQLFDMMDIATENAYIAKNHHSFFTVYSKTKQFIVPDTVEFMIIWCISAIILGYKNKHQSIVIATIIVIGLSQIVISIIASGDKNLIRDTFLYTVIFDFVNLIGLSFLIDTCVKKFEINIL